jgi:hypothetical protein
VTEIAKGDQSLSWRWFSRVADVAQRAGSAAISYVLELHVDAVRIADIQFGRAFGAAAGIRSARPYPGFQSTRGAFHHAMIGQRPGDSIDRETLHRHAEVRHSRLGVRAALGQTDVLRAGPDAETGGHILVMLNR